MLENVLGDKEASKFFQKRAVKKFSFKNPTEELHRNVHCTVYNKVQTKLATFGSGLKFSDFCIVKSLKFRSLYDENLPQLRLHIVGNLVIEDDQLGAPEAEGPVQIHVLPVLPFPQHEFPPFCRVFPPKLVRGGVANMAAGSPVVLSQHARERIPH